MNENTQIEAISASRVTLCTDGIYRWIYEFPMLKNPTILFTVWKVMGIAAMAPALIVLLADVGSMGAKAVRAGLIVFGITVLILAVISILAYLLLAAVYHGKYIVVFEMDNDTITHAQMPGQFKKAEIIGWIVALTGVKNSDPTMTGAGLLAASHSATTSVFADVDKVIGLRKRNTIKVNQLFSKNQVYVVPEDYDFVWNYITSRTKKAKITD